MRNGPLLVLLQYGSLVMFQMFQVTIMPVSSLKLHLEGMVTVLIV